MERLVELRVVVDRKRVDELTAAMVALGATGAQEAPPPGHGPVFRQPWEGGPLREPPTCTFVTWVPEGNAARARAWIEAATGRTPTLRRADDTDWSTAWRRQHRAVEVGPLRVAPPWDARPGDLVIEPGQAFGTGEHPTTRACLGWIAELAPGVRSCLDVGCGSGVLALAAARLGLEAEGIDIDPVAVADARKQARRNGLAVSFSTRPLSRLRRSRDLLVANLYAEVIVELADHLVRLAGRHLVLAGILDDRLEGVLRALRSAGCAHWRPVVVREDGPWRALHWERA